MPIQEIESPALSSSAIAGWAVVTDVTSRKEMKRLQSER